MRDEGQGTAGDEPGPAGRGGEPRPPFVGRDGLEVVVFAVAQGLDARPVVELVLEGVEIEAAGVRRRASGDTVEPDHLDADSVAVRY